MVSSCEWSKLRWGWRVSEAKESGESRSFLKILLYLLLSHALLGCSVSEPPHNSALLAPRTYALLAPLTYSSLVYASSVCGSSVCCGCGSSVCCGCGSSVWCGCDGCLLT